MKGGSDGGKTLPSSLFGYLFESRGDKEQLAQHLGREPSGMSPTVSQTRGGRFARDC